MVRLLGLARSARNDPEIFAGLVHACRYCGLLEASEAAHREARRLDPHIWTSVVYTLWSRGEMERVVSETSDASDFQLRLMALEALGRRDEALTALKAVQTASLPPVFAAIRTGLLALLEDAPGAVENFGSFVSSHTDPEAFFMYAAVQAHFGDPERALARLTRAVDGGFTAPQALREHPLFGPLRSAPAFAGLVERAEARRSQALTAFREAGGETLLGAL
jgi:tetratricopeptide (TPR) repeat protein